MSEPLTFALLPRPGRLLRHVATAPLRAGASLYDPRANAEALQRAGMGPRMSKGVAGAASVADFFTPGPIVQGALRGGANIVAAMRRRRTPQQFENDDPWMNRSGIARPDMGFAEDDWLDQFIGDRAAGRHDGGDATMMLAPASKPEARRRPQMAAQFIRSGGAPAPSDQMIRRTVRRPGGNPRMMAYLQRRIDALNRDQMKFDDDDDRFVGEPFGLRRPRQAGRGSSTPIGDTQRPTYEGRRPSSTAELSPASLIRPTTPTAGMIRGRVAGLESVERQRPVATQRGIGGRQGGFVLDPSHGNQPSAGGLDLKPEDLDFKPMQRPQGRGRTLSDMLAGIEAARRRRLAPTPPLATSREIAGDSLSLRRPAMRRILGLRRARGISGRVGRLFKETAA